MDPLVPDREIATVGKNSPKSKVSGGCSDGAVDVFGLSPVLGGGSGGASGDREPDATTFSFPLDKPVLALLGQLILGQVVEFVREVGTGIAATVGSQTIGFVPAAYRARVAALLARGGYAAVIEDISHHSVRVRVTA
jgi:hypothetical protein